MPLPSFTTTVTRKQTIADDTIEFACTKPPHFTFKAGQFVMIDTPSVDNASDIQPRAYSIASAPYEEELLFLVKLKNGGRFSTYLQQKIDVGTTLRMQGPLGAFILRPTDHALCLVATGSGIAPFRSMILQSIHAGDKRAITLLYGVRHETELVWRDALSAWAEQYGNLHTILTLSGEAADWKGVRGRVTQHLSSCIIDPVNTDLYVCGSPAMVKDVKVLAVSTCKLDAKNVYGEGYI